MSGQGNLLKMLVQRQTRFNEALKERVKSDKVKEEQLKEIANLMNKKTKRIKGE